LILLPQIASLFLERYQTDQNIISAEVVSARPLDNEEKMNLQSKLDRLTGKKTHVAWKQDPSVLGGILIRIGDFVLDGTLKARIRQVREFLMEAS
jgi:F-type H+-transporting ATPase subunit delta